MRCALRSKKTLKCVYAISFKVSMTELEMCAVMSKIEVLIDRNFKEL